MAIENGGIAMARPKTGKPKRQNLTLSVDAQTRANLDFISRIRQESISEMLIQWAAKEAKRLAKETGNEIPNVNQISLFDEANG